jgi:choice-of-anchor B domain-containing protein
MCGCNAPGNVAPPGGKELGPYSSMNVDFLSRLTLAELGAGQNVIANDCWGWADANSGREFALVGLTNATSFVEITNPTNPVYLGQLPGAGGNDVWRDIKVYKNRAYIVADGGANTSHGVQVFELSRLLTVQQPQTFSVDAHYTGLGRAHNIAINENSGFAYVIGSPSQGSGGGPIILDLKAGAMPVLVNVYSGDGYTHDIQVVQYRGPDRGNSGSGIPMWTTFPFREIAFCSNEDTLTILDVTQKNQIQQLSRTTYGGSAYSHQGWLSEDHKYFFMDDELDESGPFPTRTHVWDVRDLDAAVYLGFANGSANTRDHNLYVKGNYVYQANYTSGLRIMEIVDAQTLSLPVVGYFDTYPVDDEISFNGAWSNYPFFPSGNIIVSDRQNGLFVVRFNPPGS